MIRFLKVFFLWLPVVVYLILIYYLSSLSRISVGFDTPDFIIHMLEYFILAVLLIRALNLGFKEKVSLFLILMSLTFSTAYAILDEFHQSYVPGRTASSWDVVADACGALMGIAAIVFYQRTISLRKLSKE